MSGGPWHNLIGAPIIRAGTSGTVTLESGEVVLIVGAHASAGSATMTIFGGASIPIINGAPPLTLYFMHALLCATSGSSVIEFANTDSYVVHSVRLGS